MISLANAAKTVAGSTGAPFAKVSKAVRIAHHERGDDFDAVVKRARDLLLIPLPIDLDHRLLKIENQKLSRRLDRLEQTVSDQAALLSEQSDTIARLNHQLQLVKAGGLGRR